MREEQSEHIFKSLFKPTGNGSWLCPPCPHLFFQNASYVLLQLALFAFHTPRVGRTGRAGNKGTAITFINPEDDKYAPDLVKALQESSAPVPQVCAVPCF